MNKLFLLPLIVISLTGVSQQLSSNLNYNYNITEKYLYDKENRFHTSVKPYLQSKTEKIIAKDSVLFKKTNGKFSNIVFNKNLVNFKKDEFSFTVNPLFNFEYSKSPDTTKNGTINTRGLMIEGSIGSQFSFHTAFYENQAFFPDYRESAIQKFQRRLIPGQGLPKDFKGEGYDYAYAEGYISYTSKNNIFNINLGHGKHFIGDGYRSLILSDNSYNYPYLKITTEIWNLQYTNLWAQFQDISESTTNIGFAKKWGSMHYLDWSATKWLNIGFFEAIIWANQDSTGYRGFDVNYANPVIFFRPTEFSVGSPDNALMGINGKITLLRNLTLYSQLILDEFKLDEMRAGNGWWGNKYGIQAGMKIFDLFTIDNLFLQGEINYVRPYTYSHRSNAQNYGHYGQPLAHPLGSNFEEFVCFMKYNYKRLFFEGRFSYAIHGQDTAGINYGNNIFNDYITHTQEYGNYLGQAIKNTVIYTDFNISYLINPVTNMNIALGISNRKSESVLANTNDMLLYFAFRTSLQNFYYDF